MDAKKTASIFPMSAGFTTKAGRVAHVRLRQLRSVENLVAMQTRDRDFGRGDEIQLVALYDVHVLFEFRKLSRRRRRLAIHEKRYPRLVIPVLSGMEIHHHGDQRACESRALTSKDDESRAGDLRPSWQIEEPKCGPDVPVKP